MDVPLFETRVSFLSAMVEPTTAHCLNYHGVSEMTIREPENRKSRFFHSQQDIADRFKRLVHSEPTLSCPFLGLKDDPQTMTNYASEDNFCHCKKRPQLIPLDHQQMTCLFDYTCCPIFLRRVVAEVNAREKAEGKRNGTGSRLSTQVLRTFTNLLGIK